MRKKGEIERGEWGQNLYEDRRAREREERRGEEEEGQDTFLCVGLVPRQSPEISVHLDFRDERGRKTRTKGANPKGYILSKLLLLHINTSINSCLQKQI